MSTDWRPPTMPAWQARLLGAGMALTLAAPLVIAWWLQPDGRGWGTHHQLGMAPCGMLVSTGLPCPSCGMTTSFAHAVRLQWWRAFLAQPAGFALALGSALGVGIGGFTLLCGRWPQWLRRVSPLALFWSMLIVLVAGWAFVLARGLWTGELPAQSVKW